MARKAETKKMTGERKSNFSGRTNPLLRTSLRGISKASLDLSFGFPVDFRSFLALASRRVGACVSGRKASARSAIAPLYGHARLASTNRTVG